LSEKETVTSIRVPERLHKEIIEIAKARKMKPGTLLVQLFQEYDEWEKYQSKMRYIMMPRQLLASILDLLNEDEIVQIAKEIATRFSRERINAWFPEKEYEGAELFEKWLAHNLLTYMYGNIGEAQTTPMDEEGRTIRVVIDHDLGYKWSLFNKAYAEGDMETLFDIKPDVRISAHTIIINFKMPYPTHLGQATD